MISRPVKTSLAAVAGFDLEPVLLPSETHANPLAPSLPAFPWGLETLTPAQGRRQRSALGADRWHQAERRTGAITAGKTATAASPNQPHPRDLWGCCQPTPRHAGHAPSIKKEVFSFSSNSTWMALSGSSPYGRQKQAQDRRAERGSQSVPCRRRTERGGQRGCPCPLAGWSLCRLHPAGEAPLLQGLSRQGSQEALGAYCEALPA